MESKAIGSIVIIVKNRSTSASKVNATISDYGSLIIGRMGIPYHERDLNIITLIVDATTDEIGSLTGKLGQIPEVTVKSTIAKLSKGTQDE